jgi:predicted metal-dependent HD superfamily phosphohydrolase
MEGASLSQSESSDLSNELFNSSPVSNACFDPLQKTELRSMLMMNWTRAIDSLTQKNYNVSNKWFDRLWSLHTEPCRHYHTAVHLEEMIHFFTVLREKGFPENMSAEDEQAILLAIFFHDAIYDPKSSSNEEDSALLFESFTEEYNVSNERLVSKVSTYIRATQKHLVSVENSIALAIFLDLDMSVLGKKDESYRAYATMIRREYEFVPSELYCQKRAEILELFLEQPFIYGTLPFRETFELMARGNVQREIEALRKGIIYGEEGTTVVKDCF